MNGTDVPRLTNEQVGDLIGLSHASVSRIKVGLRLPSLEIMRQIEQVMDWPLHAQAEARAVSARNYANIFLSKIDQLALKLHAERPDEPVE
jgi:DNA-binding XRE family transcriptional regulator